MIYEEIDRVVENIKLLVNQKKYEAAVAAGQQVVNNCKDKCLVLYMMAFSYMHLAKYENAQALIEEIKQIDREYIGAYMVEAYVYKLQGRIETQIVHLLDVIKRIKKIQIKDKTKPYQKSLSEAWSLLGSSYTLLGQNQLALDAFLNSSKLEENKEQSIREYSNALFVTNYIDHLSDAKMKELHFGYQKFFTEIKPYIHFAVKKEKIKIAYLSPDFRQHPVAFFVYPLLADFTKADFEVYVYAANQPDAMTNVLQKNIKKWRDISGMDAARAARMIYDDEIDILFDLSGHTRNNCLPILAYKPAPIQISGIGYFNTTGLNAVDYFLSDVYCNSSVKIKEMFSEKIIALQHSHFCYVPSADMPPCGEPPSLKKQYITFGSFNNFSKVTDEVLYLWQRILAKVPNSKLVLKSKIFDMEEGKRSVENRLIRLGFDLDKVELRPFTINYLNEYNDIDIALDTYPYTGGVTTCEALYMGIPVVSLVGTRHGSRFGYSLLQNAGLAEFIAASEDEYVEKAAFLAGDLSLLAGLRKEMRKILCNSSLMDTKQYVNEVENAYKSIWKAYLCAEDKIENTLALKDFLWELIEKRDYRQGETVAHKILVKDPKEQNVLGILVGIYIETGKVAFAKKWAHKLREFYPKYGYGAFLSARIDYMQDEWELSIVKSQQALKQFVLNDDMKSRFFNLLGNSYKSLGESEKSVESYLKASQYSVGVENKAVDYSNALFNMHYLQECSQLDLYKIHEKYNDLFSRIEVFQHKIKVENKKIRIGYISPDMRYHVVTFFSYALFRNYDHSVFEVICYANCTEDEISQQIAATVDAWRNISGLSTKAAAEVIYKDQIDILFDLAGHTRNNCLPILAYKPAPIQISGIGYFDTTGLKTIDYFLADVYTDPVGQNDEYFTEKVLRLPHSHFCYVPPDTMPECGAAACKRNGYVTFGSFNNFSKTTNKILNIWGKIMAKVPKSRLLLKSKIFATEAGCRKVEERLNVAGIDLQRVEMRPETKNYLNEYAEVDIALDTYPYPGGGTTCEALYMGVPVITLSGKRHGARFGFSLLKNVGIEECCAFSEDEYIKIAIDLGTDIDRINSYHLHLRDKMKASLLMNRNVYLQDIEDVYLQIWKRNLEKQDHLFIVEAERELMTAIFDAENNKNWAEAIRIFRMLEVFGNKNIEIFKSAASAYFNLKEYDRSIYTAKKAIKFGNEASAAELYALIGAAYQEESRYCSALKAYEQADYCLSVSGYRGSRKFQAALKKSQAYMQVLLGQTEKAAENYLKASEISADIVEKTTAYSSYLLSLQYRNISRAKLYEAHCGYQKIFAGVKPFVLQKANHSEKLRVAYISPDFRHHVMFYFYHQLLACYDKNKFQVTCYSLTSEIDNFTKHLQGLVDEWRDVSDKTYEQIAEQIAFDEIDILVDLAGHSSKSGLPVLAYKAAPLQISGLGYVATTGLKQVDYFLSDEYINGNNEQKCYFTENILELGSSQFCYTGRSDLSVSEGAPSRRKGYITFASFNAYAKITDKQLNVWLRILRQVPQSILLLKSQVFASQEAVDLAKERLQQIGYDIRQVKFLPATSDYMEDYLDVDIALDTYPYPGGGTTCDALYMGVPVISLYGKSHGSRFGYSILKNIGLEDLAVYNEENYVLKAIALAEDVELLDLLHKNLRSMMLNSSLMDEKKYIRTVETIYQRIWNEYRKSIEGKL